MREVLGKSARTQTVGFEYVCPQHISRHHIDTKYIKQYGNMANYKTIPTHSISKQKMNDYWLFASEYRENLHTKAEF